MKRFHVHVAVVDLAESIRFYSSVFAVGPSVLKEDYAKWMLEDPRINFAISKRGQKPGINHLGLQVESDEELQDIHARLEKADGAIVAEEGVACCYARSDKYWITDPQGVAWESFRSLGEVPMFNGDSETVPAAAGEAACCAPAPSKLSTIAIKSPTTGACCN
jgi:catechol 2,3-dioxygenase-like lactoylglutathione lyase family enzyme